MSSHPTIAGIIPPIVTPLIKQDVIDTEGLGRLLDQLVSAGVHGIFALGTTGEGPSLSHPTRRKMVRETARLLNGRLPLYVGITDTSMAESMELAKVSADNGAAALVAAPPFYFPAGQEELQHWFNTMLAQLPLPLMLYNMPGCTKTVLEPETIAALIDHESVIGLKDSSGDLNYLETALDIAARHRPDWPILVGPEHLLIKSLRMGAVGGVAGGANLAPRLFTELYTVFQNSDSSRLSELEETLNQLQQLYTIGAHGSAFLKGVKCALELCNVCSGNLEEPFDAFHPPERKRVTEFLSSFSKTGFLPQTYLQTSPTP